MKLLFVYIEDFRVHKTRSFNLDAEERFVLDGVSLRMDVPIGRVPRNFFHKANHKAQGFAEVSSRVDSISAIIGENGSGKTSLAEFLNGAFASGKYERRFLYIVRVDDEQGAHYLCRENLEISIDDAVLQRRYGRAWERKHYDVETESPPVGLVYYSPFYTPRSDWFVGANDAFVDISTVARLQGHSSREYNRNEAETIDRIVDRFAERKRAFFKGAPMICPAEVVARINEGYVSSIQRMLKQDDLLSEEIRQRLIVALDIVEIPDVIVKMTACLLAGVVERYLLWTKEIRIQEREVLDRIYTVGELVTACHRNHTMRHLEYQERSRLVATFRYELSREGRKELRTCLVQALKKNFVQQGFSVAGVRKSDFWPLMSRRLITTPIASFVDLAIKFSTDANASSSEIHFRVRGDQERKDYYDFKGAYALLTRKVFSRNKGVPIVFETKGLSAGELSYLSMMGRLDEIIGDQAKEKMRIAQTNLILFLDEAETTLHPEWQRRLVENIIWYIENFTSKLHVHVIFASHSPTLLSDLPRGNVCVLPRRKDENGSCHAPEIETFGMNIYDLYRLMATEQGCISGRFSSEKIKKLFKDQITDVDRELIEMVGDPMVRAYLENLALKSERKNFV